LQSDNNIPWRSGEPGENPLDPTMSQSPQAGQGASYCARCGRQWESGQNFCPGCGHQPAGPAIPSDQSGEM